MLLNDDGNVIGFARKCGTRIEYADLRTSRWFREEIDHVDETRLYHPPKGLRSLKRCR
jgi:hypothetical protein